MKFSDGYWLNKPGYEINYACEPYEIHVSDHAIHVVATHDVITSRGQTLAEMALSWILRDGIVTSVLIGASKPSQILDNIQALENTAFSDEEQATIDRITEAVKSGNRAE